MVLPLLTSPPPTEAAVTACLLRRGFLPASARRLAPLLLRFGHGEFSELAGRASHLLFTAWLVDHGLLTDTPAPPRPPAANGVPAAFAAVPRDGTPAGAFRAQAERPA